MKKPADKYLRDLIRELDDVSVFTADGKDTFMRNVQIQKAVIRSYEVIGEIAKRLPADLRDPSPNIDWRKLITFRDFLAHNYETIALRFVWEAVEDVPALRTEVEALLKSLDAGGEQN